MFSERVSGKAKGIGKMKKQNSRSLNGKLSAIALAAFLPMLVVLIYALFSLTEATKAYSEITKA